MKYRDYFLLFLVAAYGVYAPIAAELDIDFPMKFIVAGMAVVILILTTYTSSTLAQVKCLLGVAFIGIEQIMFTIPVILIPQVVVSLIRKRGTVLKKWSFLSLAFFALVIVQLIVSNAIEFSGYTILFWYLIFGFTFIFFILFSQKQYSYEDVVEIFAFLRKLILLELVVLILQSFIHRDLRPGDHWNGSFLDPDKTGFYITLLLLFYLLPPLLRRDFSIVKLTLPKTVAYVAVLTLFVILCDSKIKSFLTIASVFSLSILCLIIFLVRKSFSISRTKALTLFGVIILSTTIIAATINAYLRYISESQLTVRSVIGQYTTNPPPGLVAYGVNGKYLLYERVYRDLLREDPLKWVWGEGPGKFNSRTSNMLAYDVLYKDPDQFKLPAYIPPYSSPMVKKYMAGMWTREKAEFITFISANLSFPFAGWITVKGEMGIIGVIGYLLLTVGIAYYLVRSMDGIDDSRLKNWALVLAVFWLSLPLQMLVDNIQEKPQIMYPMLVLTAVLLGRANTKKTDVNHQ